MCASDLQHQGKNTKYLDGGIGEDRHQKIGTTTRGWFRIDGFFGQKGAHDVDPEVYVELGTVT